MAGHIPERPANIVIESVQKASVRCILATGWGGLKAADLPDTILQIDQEPHDWLFPRMVAILHHCSAGTTAASLKAGKPSIVVSFFGD
jgi:sterol 3beta-glucosyltransferase